MSMLNPPHPGRSLKRDCIDYLELTITEVAERLGVTRLTLSKVLNQRSGISPELAIRLEKLGWGTADNWLAMQQAYDLAKVRKRSSCLKVKPFTRLPAIQKETPLHV